MKHCVFAALLLVALLAHAQDIKGVRIGMTKDAYRKLDEAVSFTVGGVYPKYAAMPEFDEKDQLTRFTLIFRSSDYADIRAAVKTKYPKTKCVHSSVSTKSGASFPQEHCTFGSLLLSQFVGDIDTSALSLVAPESEKAKRQREQNRKDM